jgi:hypothetical protein
MAISDVLLAQKVIELQVFYLNKKDRKRTKKFFFSFCKHNSFFPDALKQQAGEFYLHLKKKKKTLLSKTKHYLQLEKEIRNRALNFFFFLT